SSCPAGRLSSLCFFFSSRRRHTRFSRDWSSDVCSSDLEAHVGCLLDRLVDGEQWRDLDDSAHAGCRYDGKDEAYRGPFKLAVEEIGRASCRERVWRSVVAAGWE